MTSTLDALFAPRSIAFVGASGDPTRIGGRPLSYCLRERFAGPLYPINAGRSEVQGLTAYASIDAVPEAEIDLAVIAIAPGLVADAIRDAGRKGVKATVILSSGFAEVGESGAALQSEMLDAARTAGIRLLGPNSLGAFSNGTGMCATFSSLLEDGSVPMGPLGIVSQSGAYGAHLAMLMRRRGVGLSRFVTTGNEADITVADCLSHMAGDPDVGVIGCYSEGIADGRAFLAAAEAARAAGKPVVMLKVGRSEDGRKAAQSHTASLAGDDAVFDAAARAAGVERVETTQAFVDLLYTLCRRPPVAGNRLGVLTVSGGAGVLMADAASAAGFRLPPMPEAAQAAIAARVPFGSAVNPIDTTAQAMNDPTLVRDATHAMLAEGGYDAVVSFFMNWPDSPLIGPGLRAAIAEGMAGHEERTVAMAMNASDETRRAFDAAGMLVFDDPSHAVVALAASRRIGEALARSGDIGASLPPTVPLPRRSHDEAEAVALLAAAGVPMTDVVTAPTPDAVAAASTALGRRVALKILSPDILHKSDIGGVVLGLEGEDAVRTAATAMLARCTAAAPAATIRGFLAAPMAASGLELLVGARIDHAFGPIVTVGLGGVFVEIFRDVAIGLAPLHEAGALALLRSLKAWPLLAGARGRAPADVDAAARAIAALSRFAATHRDDLVSVEVNPLVVHEQGATGLDAVIVTKALAA
jgi:acyl-CoA synthetase (NDP forming)